MPWKDASLMDLREQLIDAFEKGVISMSDICAQFEISRKTGYKWLARKRQGGKDWSKDLSRAPKSQPGRAPADVRAAIVKCRKDHLTWGPKKIVSHLRERDTTVSARLPALSTVGDILKAEGLIKPRRKRNKSQHPGSRPLVADEPNEVWCVDYKGEFRTRDGKLCYPFTVTDACSRRLLTCIGHDCISGDKVRIAMLDLFKWAGLPKAIRSDNGAPFCAPARGGISRLWVLWTKLGIRHDRIRPSSPQENGRHEYMHRVLKAETTRPAAQNMRAQQERFDTFVKEYNEIRPHEAIGMKTPASLWHPSPRKLPDKLPVPIYPEHMIVRRVRKNGKIKLKGLEAHLSKVLVGEPVGLDEVREGIWAIYYFDIELGRLNQETMKITSTLPDPKQRSKGTVADGDRHEDETTL